jgi:hypothetical protein
MDGLGPVEEGEEFPPLREQDVTLGDRLDDRVSEGEGLPEEDEGGE